MSSHRVSIIVSFIAVLAVLAACSTPPRPISFDPPLPDSSPAEEGMDGALLFSASRQIADASHHRLHSFLVARNGRVVFEEYYNGYSRDTPHDMRSATKSITSLLVGIALDLGVFESLDDPLVTYLGSSYPELSISSDITLRHAITMSSGLDCDDWDRSTRGQEDRMYRSRDWVRYFLSLPEVDTPGSRVRYCTGGVVALGAAISAAADMPVDEFADRYLFAPLGITNYRWARFDRGAQVDTGGHLLLTPQGMARIGLMVLEGGLWNDRVIVSSHWLEESMAHHNLLGDTSYGYLWWRYEVPYGEESITTIVARGNGGQTLFLVPEYDLLGVFTAGYYNDPRSAISYELFFQAVLPSVLELREL